MGPRSNYSSDSRSGERSEFHRSTGARPRIRCIGFTRTVPIGSFLHNNNGRRGSPARKLAVARASVDKVIAWRGADKEGASGKSFVIDMELIGNTGCARPELTEFARSANLKDYPAVGLAIARVCNNLKRDDAARKQLARGAQML